MNEQESPVQDVKEDTAKTAGEEKQSVDQVPYARFKELIDEKNEAKSQLDDLQKKIKNDKDTRKIKELEGHYKGPKKLKASGKAAGVKKKKDKKSVKKVKSKAKPKK